MQAGTAAPPQLLGDELQPGINVIGYLRAINGTAEGGRLLLAALERTGIPFETIDYKASPSQVGRDIAERRDGVPVHDINLLCVNADMTPQFARDAGPGIFLNRYTIGTWAWETEELPPYLFGALDWVDEVWVPSEYARRAVQKVTEKPVFTFHHPITPPPVDPTVTRATLGLPDAFTFLFIFDYFSVARRKNPDGLVAAFKQAFGPGEGPVLVIKTINADRRPDDAGALADSARSRDDIVIIDRYMPSDHKNALIALADCYVSLHRSEGFGLTLAEAMALGKPVIATGYSGNLDFMTAENSYLVMARPVLVGGDSAIYPANGRWGEPDLADAARLMRHVYEEPAEAAAVGEMARRDIEKNNSVDKGAAFIRTRYGEVRNGPMGVISAGGDRWSMARAMQRASLALARGPQVDMRTAGGGLYGQVSRGYRRILRRVLRNNWVYQQEVGNALLEAIRETDARRHKEAAELSRRLSTIETALAAPTEPMTPATPRRAVGPDRPDGV